MSYQDRVIRDNPVGFWILDSSPAMGYDYSAGYFSSGVRTTNAATTGAGVIYNDVLPICTGGTNGARISSTSTSKITITNNYECFYKNTENETLSIEFWLNFVNIPVSSTIMSIGTSISFSFSDNIAKLTLTDSTSTTYNAYLNVEDYDSQLHVVVAYTKKSIFFYINGIKSTVINFTGNFAETASHNIVFGPATLTDYFIIDCIAVYDYVLILDDIASHIIWATSNSNPQKYTIAQQGGVYDASDEDGLYINKYIYSNGNDWSNGYLNNCIVEGNSLTVKKIKALSAYNTSQSLTPSIGYTTQSSRTGLTTTGFNSAVMQNFNKYFTPQNQVIQCQVYVSSVASREAYFSISGFSFGTLVLEKPTSSTNLRIFSETDTSLDIIKTSLTTGWHDVKISFNGNSITLTVDGTLVATDILDTGTITLSDSSLYLGNYYSSSTGAIVSSPTTSPIQNFSIFNDSDTRANTYSNTGNISIKLNNSLNVSQYAEWKIVLPLDETITIMASKLYYIKNSNNLSVYCSIDGSTWVKQGTQGEQIPALPLNAVGVPIYIKITMESLDSYYGRTKISYMELLTYSTLNSYSNGKIFSIKEYASGFNSHTYNLKNRAFNLLARPVNFGMHFEPVTGSQVPGMAIINVPSGEVYQTIEFWFRIDTNAGASNNYILDINSPTAASLSHNASLVLNYAGADWSAVYINGQSYTNNSKTLVLGEIYHFMGVLSATKSDEIGINAKHNYTFHSNSTYGEICLYPDAKTQPFAQSKYNMQLGINKQIISDVQLATGQDNVNVYNYNWQILSVQAE